MARTKPEPSTVLALGRIPPMTRLTLLFSLRRSAIGKKQFGEVVSD
jgi:hypothetical protein